MGKTTRWIKRLIAKLRSDSPPKHKKTSSTTKSSSIRGTGDAISSEVRGCGTDESRKHAIAVAEASAAAAQAAMEAAQAAAAVVRLTASGRRFAALSSAARENKAALLIQSHFRGYLARRALRALKGLVKLQALVRGHIMRKRTAQTAKCVESMLRTQARARSMRARDSPTSSDKSPQFYYPGPQTPDKLEQISYSNTQSPVSRGLLTPEKLEHASFSYSNFTKSPLSRGPLTPEKLEQISYGTITKSPLSKGCGSRSFINRANLHPYYKGYTNSPVSCSTEEDSYILQSDKILEIDSEHNHDQSIEYEEGQDEFAFCTEESTPPFYPASSRRKSPMTPPKSDTSSASCPIGHSGYMAYTESSRAKVRSLSAPRQRSQLFNEKTGLKKRPVVQQNGGYSGGVRASLGNKAYTGSGRLDGLGMVGRSDSRRFSMVDV